MGLQYGALKITEILKCGLYRHNVDTYTIYIDGELMRYKGVVAKNLSTHNICENIADTSFDYMTSMISHIENMMSCKATDVLVYMDGTRVKNKIIRNTSSSYDVTVVRNMFMSKCVLNNIKVHQLEHGESELQMYLQRNRTNQLNIFLTSDSDMIAILYDHQPIVKAEKLSFTPILSTSDRIANFNLTYTQDCIDVLDSCLWINCVHTVTAIGCDFSRERIRYHKRIFSVFIGMCGTDFTDGLLTETMIRGILNASTEDVSNINMLYNDNLATIVQALVYLGVKNDGTLKLISRRNFNTTMLSNNLEDYIKNLEHYIKYIESGIMTQDEFVAIDGAILCRKIFNMLGYKESTYKKSTLQTWIQLNKFETLFGNKNIL